MIFICCLVGKKTKWTVNKRFIRNINYQCITMKRKIKILNKKLTL